MEQHQAAVRKIQAEVRRFYDRHQKIRIFHGASNSTRKPEFKAGRYVNTSALNHVLEVNKQARYVIVEPSVPMDRLAAETLAHGLLPPVVMEFPGITVGGGIQGGAAESSSFKWGGFHETALEYEMILGDGSRLTVSRKSHPDLFWGTACTYGSLGIITSVKLKLIPAANYVRLTYYRTGSVDETLARLEVETKRPAEFVDGILFRRQHGVVMTGSFTNEANGHTASFSKSRDPWFYLHAQSRSGSNGTYEEYIPIKDYLFRYDRGAFWMGRQALDLFHIPFNSLTRRTFDSQMHTRRMYEWLHATNLSQRYIVQDCCMPRSSIKSFLRYVDDKLGIYPLWLLPLKPSGEPLDKFGLSFTNEDLVINVGVWGKTAATNFNEFVEVNRDFEKAVFKLNGRKTLYAHAYYPEGEFWQLYDKTHYDFLRKKYRAERIFENLYDKVTVRQAYDTHLYKAFWQNLKTDVSRTLTFDSNLTV
jgi:FAD/FMN-containing dehydrogenase